MGALPDGRSLSGSPRDVPGCPTQLPKPRVVTQRRERRTHAGNGVLQQELGPLAPRRSLLLLELLR